MEYINESIPYGSTRPCQAPTAREAYAAVCAFARDIFPGWRVQREVSAMIREATGGKTWTATGPDDWALLTRRFGGGA